MVDQKTIDWEIIAMDGHRVTSEVISEWKKLVHSIQLEAKAYDEHTIAFLLEMALEEISNHPLNVENSENNHLKA